MSALPRTNPVAAEAASRNPAAAQAQDPASEMIQLEKVLRSNPTDVDLLLRASGLMQRAGRIEQALDLLTKAATLAPERPETIVAQAELLRANALHEEAVELLQHAIGKKPQAAALRHAMGKTVLELADLDGAARSFDEALRLDPEFHLCRLERAALQLRRGWLQEALADYECLRQVAPNDPGVLTGLGDVKAAMGDLPGARLAFAAAAGLLCDPAPITDRLQRLAIMEFSRPLPRADLPPAETGPAPARPGAIDIVFFHIDVTSDTKAPFDKPDYQTMLVHATAVAHQRAPAARIILLTDEHTRLSADLRVDRVIRSRIDNVELMIDRLRLARDFLASGDAAENVVFLDSDVAVNRNPAEIFNGSFDVALTWRTTPHDAPINAGVVLCRTGPAAVRLYDHMIATLEAIDKHPAVVARFGSGGVRRWWGDQLAMAATVGWSEFARRQSDRLEVDGTIVRFLPATNYNFTIDAALPTPKGFEEKFFIHFKGSRKSGLAHFAKSVIGKPPTPTAPAHASSYLIAARAAPRIHFCVGNHSAVGQKTLTDLLANMWAALDELGFKVTISASELRRDAPNIIFEWRNHRFKKILEQNRGRMKLICVVTEIIKGDKFDDGGGSWNGTQRFREFLSILDHYAGFITTIPSNVGFLKAIAPTTFFEFGYSDRLLTLSDWRSWKHDFSCSGAMTPHRRKFLADVSGRVKVRTPGDPHAHTAELCSVNEYLELIKQSAINICLKQHPTWEYPSGTRLSRILHAGVGCALEATSVAIRLSPYVPVFTDADDFLNRFAEVDRQKVASEALERLSLYRTELPMRREAERMVAECPPLVLMR